MANGERLEVVKGKLFCSSKVISGKLYIPQRFASGIKLWHTIVKKLPSSSVYERWQYGGEWKMEQKQPQLTSDKNKIKIGIQNSKAKGPTKTIAKIYQFQELLEWCSLFRRVSLFVSMYVCQYGSPTSCLCNSPHVSDTVFPPSSLWDTGCVSSPHP